MMEQSEQVLIEKAIGQDLESFKVLSGKYFASLVAIAHARLNDRHLAEDAAQETLFQAWKALPGLKKPDRFGPWLAAICRNITTDLIRRRKLATINVDLRHVPDPAFPPQDSFWQDAVQSAIQNLPADAKELVYLKYYDGLTYPQISAVLGITEVAVNGRLRRAKKQLAKTLRKTASIEVNL